MREIKLPVGCKIGIDEVFLRSSLGATGDLVLIGLLKDALKSCVVSRGLLIRLKKEFPDQIQRIIS